MLTTDFDVKIKLIILTAVGLLALAGVLSYIYHLNHQLSRRVIGIGVVMLVLLFILISLLMIHQ